VKLCPINRSGPVFLDTLYNTLLTVHNGIDIAN